MLIWFVRLWFCVWRFMCAHHFVLFHLMLTFYCHMLTRSSIPLFVWIILFCHFFSSLRALFTVIGHYLFSVISVGCHFFSDTDIHSIFIHIKIKCLSNVYKPDRIKASDTHQKTNRIRCHKWDEWWVFSIKKLNIFRCKYWTPWIYIRISTNLWITGTHIGLMWHIYIFIFHECG